MRDWTLLPLRDRVVNHDRKRVPVRGRDRRSGPYPYYGASGVVDHVDGYLFEGLHLLVAEDGENLRTRKTPVAFLASGRFWVNNHAHVLTGDDHNDTRFLFYAVELQDVRGLLSGSTQPKLTQAALGELPILAPALEEQRGIAATLGALDDKIDSNRRLIVGAMAILDLQAERAVQGLDRCALRHLVTSVKEPIDVRKLGDDTVEHYSLPAFDARGEPDRVPANSIMSNKLRVPDGSVLLSRLNPKTNRTWLAHPMDPTRAVASTEWLVAVPAPRLRLGAIWLALRDEDFLATLVRRASGTSGSHQRVRPEDLLDIETLDARLLPPAITAEAQELLQMGHQRRTEIARLQSMRNALLPELLSGRLRVPEGQQMVDAVS